MKDLRTTYNTFLAPFLSIKPSEKISSESGVLRKTTDTAFEAVYNTQVLDGCPTKKCNSPDILKAIMTQYNIENAPTGQYAVEKHTMSKVLKAGIASKNECDIMFANQVEKFDDIMYDPVDTRVYAKVLRFKLKHEGNCVFSVVPSQSYDVSSNAIGLRSDTSALPTAYTGPACQVDCRNTTLLRRLKEVYEEATPRTTLKKIVQSYTAGSGTCEYRILKDTTYDDPDEGVPVTLRDVATFLRVNYAVSDASICKYDLRGRSDLTEVDPEKIEFDEEEEEPVPMINGVQVVVPSLASYDESKRSKKVNATPIGPTF
jgi:hypothetical protein